MIRFGVKDKILEEGYFDSTPCVNCGNTKSNYFIVWAKTFFFGPLFFPINWFTWGKNANVTCNNCKKSLHLDEATGQQRIRLQEKFDEQKVWKSNILSYLILTFLVYSIFGSIFRTVKSSFTDKETYIRGHWILSGIYIPELDNLNQNLIKESDKVYINFYDNNSYSIIFSDTAYLSGRWEYNKDNQTLNMLDSKENFILNIEEPTEDQLKINSILLKIGEQSEYQNLFKNVETFKKDDNDFSNIIPLKPEYNKWRIRSLKEETPLEIKNRMVNFLQYYQILFSEAHKNDISFLNNEFSTPFKVSSSGISIGINKDWEKNFYSGTNANQAYDYLEKSFPKELNFNEKNTFKRMKDFFSDYIKRLENLEVQKTQ